MSTIPPSNDRSRNHSSEIHVTPEKKSRSDNKVDLEDQTYQYNSSARSQPILQSSKKYFNSINIPLGIEKISVEIMTSKMIHMKKTEVKTIELNNENEDDLKDNDYIQVDYTNDTHEDDPQEVK